uniref:Calitoxin n=1 Tax=Calliactis polypus TaxID=656064 RepID=TXCL1_CALPY
MKTQVLVVLVLCVVFCLAESRNSMTSEERGLVSLMRQRDDIAKRLQCKCKGDAPDLSHMSGTIYFSCEGGDNSWKKCNSISVFADCCHKKPT